MPSPIHIYMARQVVKQVAHKARRRQRGGREGGREEIFLSHCSRTLSDLKMKDIPLTNT